MAAGNPAIRGLQWLLDEWATRFAAGFEAMTGQALPRNVAPAPVSIDQPLLWRQPFDIADGAAVEITIPSAGWRAIGSLMLAGAGIDEATDEDSRPTYLEVLQQSLSGLATALSAAVGREVGCGTGGEAAPAAAAAAGMEFQVGGQSFVCGFSASSALVEALRPAAPAAALPATVAPASLAAAPNTPPSALEVLYDVELPVSVSFGRAHLPVKEVLKLTSGSIVELNRGIAEPVEVIVNNCVIARGEVVVVEGNYGVRILEIISRSERLRTLH